VISTAVPNPLSASAIAIVFPDAGERQARLRCGSQLVTSTSTGLGTPIRPPI
jgi:hypothetical protein